MSSNAGKRFLVVGTLAVCLGGGRLAFDEVELANQRARFSTLEARASEAEADRKLVIRLEHDLTAAQEERKTARDQLEAVTQEAREGLAEQQRVTEKLSADLQAAATELETLGNEAQRVKQRAEALEGERDLARQEAALEARRRKASEAAAAEITERLRNVEAVADERGLVLDKVRAAGVNVARLSGERPMPRISAVVVRIDANASPIEVLVDAGSSAGLEVGDRLYVLKRGRDVACLQVVELGEQIASTRLVRGVRGLDLRAGDDVTSRPADPQ